MPAILVLPGSTSAIASLNYGQGVAPSSPTDGDQWYDSTQKTIKASINGATYNYNAAVSVTSVAPAALASLNGAGTFATVVLPTAFMNVGGKVLRVKMYGLYSTAGAQTPTIGIQLAFSGAFTQTELVATSQATTASQTNFPWEFEGHIFTVSTGAAGTLEAHGKLSILIGSVVTATESVYQDVNTAANGAVNLTAAGANNLLLQATTSAVLSSIQLRSAVVEVLN
jgi:hypothetical protein